MSKAQAPGTHTLETTYTVYASYLGGPSEIVEQGLDREEALDLARKLRLQFGWDAWTSCEEEE